MRPGASARETARLVTPTTAGCRIRVKVIPRARRSCLDGVRDGALLVRLAAAPVDGQANDSLMAFIADLLRVPRSCVTIGAGAHARLKLVDVAGCTVADVDQRLRSVGPT